jgi:hypothetical protein
VNQTINAAPGQSEHAVGNAAADAITDARDNWVEQTYNKLIPLAGTGG